MVMEIKKTNWLKFCKKFNQANQYRQSNIKIEYESKESVNIEPSTFLGLAVSKKGRWINEISLVGGSKRFDMVVEPVVTIQKPVAISVVKDEWELIVTL